MNGIIKKAGLAVALAATAVTASAPADAQRYGGYRGGYHHGGGNVAGAAILGGLVGLGVGAAIADSHRGYYGGPGYYGRGYYGAPGYYGGSGYRGYYGGYYAPRCWRQWRFDPYIGRQVAVRVCN